MAKLVPWVKQYQSLMDLAKRTARRGWCPAGSGLFSSRLPLDLVAVTSEGCDKEFLDEKNLVTVDMQARAQRSAARPGSDSLLHTTLYQLDPSIGVVIQAHTVSATVLARKTFDDFALLHGMPNLANANEDRFAIRVIDGNQSMEYIVEQLKTTWQIEPLKLGCLLRNRGLLVWGKDFNEAWQHLEALDFLMNCELACLSE